MDKQKYNNYPLAISQILGLIEANDIAIPEIQRPFVCHFLYFHSSVIFNFSACKDKDNY